MRYTKPKFSAVLQIFAAVVLSVAPPALTFLALNGEEGGITILTYAAVVPLLYAARMLTRGRISRVFLWLFVLVNLLGASAVVVSMNLTPASAYLAWFRLVQDGTASGVLSFMFSLKIAVFSALIGSMVFRHTVPLPVLASAAIHGFILYAVFQLEWIALSAIAAAVGAVVLLALRTDREVRGRAVIVGLQLLAVSALIALPASRIKPDPFNPLVSILSQDALARTTMSVYPGFPFLYNMPGYGHQLGEGDIGGRPSLTARPVFTVTANAGETIYLRTAVYDVYAATGWAQNAIRIGEAREGFRRYLTDQAPSEMVDPIRVDVAIDFFSSVPHTVDTSSVNLYRGDFPPLEYGSPELGFVFTVPVVRGTTFYLNRSPGEPETPADFTGYLRVPEDAPDSVRQLVAERWADRDPMEASQSIIDFFAANYFYTLDAPTVPRNTNPVWFFLLQDGRGYCVQFATAFTLLARMAGIPARYVTGFLVTVPRDADTATVTGYSSHAWSEIWVPERGWVVREATPPMDPRFFDDPEFYQLYNPFGSGYTARQLELILGDRVAAAPEARREAPRTVPKLPLIAVPLALLAAFAALTFMLRSTHAPVSAPTKLRRIVRKMVSQAGASGAPSPARIGWIEWSDRVSEVRPEYARHLRAGVHLLLRLFFGGETVRSRDLRYLRGLYARVFR